MNQKASEFREKLTEQFISVLENDPGGWIKTWIEANRKGVFNAKTNRSYSGINAAMLTLISIERGYDDPRFATFNQIKEMGLYLKEAKGKGIRIEYWMPRDIISKKIIQWSEYNLMSKDEKVNYEFIPKYSTVFNARHIEGIKPYEPPEDKKVIDDFELEYSFTKLVENMKIPVIEEGNEAVYFPEHDMILMPPRTHFYSQYDYYSTLAHELAHSTAHPMRMNRETGDYAAEELRAEISSCFFCADTGLELSQEHMENHKAYVKWYIKALKDDPYIFTSVIKDAQNITDYLEYKAEFITKDEYDKKNSKSFEADDGKNITPVKNNDENIYKKNEVPYEKHF